MRNILLSVNQYSVLMGLLLGLSACTDTSLIAQANKHLSQHQRASQVDPGVHQLDSQVIFGDRLAKQQGVAKRPGIAKTVLTALKSKAVLVGGAAVCVAVYLTHRAAEVRKALDVEVTSKGAKNNQRKNNKKRLFDEEDDVAKAGGYGFGKANAESMGGYADGESDSGQSGTINRMQGRGHYGDKRGVARESEEANVGRVKTPYSPRVQFIKNTVDTAVATGTINRCGEDYGDTLLNGEVLIGTGDSVALLLRSQADVEIRNKLGNTPLLSACQWSHRIEACDIVRELIKARADVDACSSDGRTPLMLTRKRSALAKLLIEAGANMMAQNPQQGNYTALTYAVHNSDVEMVRCLCEAYGKQKGKEEQKIADTTSLYRAFDNLFYTDATEEQQRIREEIFDLVLNCPGIDCSAPVVEGFSGTLLSEAIKKNRFDIVRKLCIKGVSCVNDCLMYDYIKGQDPIAITPLMWAAKEKNKELFLILLEAPNLDIAVQQSKGDTVLHYIIRSMQEDMVAQKATKPINQEMWQAALAYAQKKQVLDTVINIKGDKNRTILHIATNLNDAALIRSLIAFGADISARGNGGNTPLISAVIGGHVEVVEEMLKLGKQCSLTEQEVSKGVDLINAQGFGNCAALRRAVARLNYDNLTADQKDQGKKIVKLLVAEKADVNCAYQDAWHPLPDLVKANSAELVQLFLDNGLTASADIMGKNASNEQSLVSQARGAGNHELVEILEGLEGSVQ